MEFPFVTVGIITKNEEQHIARTLASVLDSDYPRDRFEVLVVDGNSIDRTRDIVRDVMDSNPSVKLLLEPWERGSHGRARNLLADNARGDYVAYTDGDCLVERDWLRMLVTTIDHERKKDPSIAVVGGTRTPAPTEDWKETLLNTMLSTWFGSGGSCGFVKTRRKYVTSVPNYNCIYVTDIIKRERYSSLGVGEDFEFNTRLNRRGYRIVFCPGAVVYHHLENSFSDFLKKLFDYGRIQPVVYRATGGIRHFAVIALLGLAVILGGGILSLLYRRIRRVWLGLIALYSAADVLSTVRVMKRTGRFSSCLALMLYPLEHLAYALGIVRGIIEAYVDE